MRILQRLLTCLLALPGMVALTVGLPRLAHADGDLLGHGDRTASLYRDVLRLDGQGNPLLPMSVLSHQERLEVSAPGGLRILGTGDGLVELRLQGPVEVGTIAQQPGVYQHFVVLASAPAYDFDTLRKQKADWRARGLPVRTLGTGTNYSLAGRGFDTRVTLLCLDEALPTRAAADQKTAELERKYSLDLSVHTTVAEPPTATLVAKGQGGSEVRAADVLWFEAVGKGMLHVAGTGKAGRRELDLPGRIYVVPGGQGGLEIVNEAELERILEGVVASEIFHSAPEAALRAQAVAARTDMLAKVGTRHATDPFAICSEVHCQAYTGMGKVSPRIAQAVKDTKGLVMVDPEGHLVDAYYHAVSGGHTENNENAWPGRPQPALRGRSDLVAGAKDWFGDEKVTDERVAAMLADKDGSWAAASGLNAEAGRWTTERTAQELSKTLQAVGVDKAVTGIRVTQRGVSGRATEVELTLQGGTLALVQGELRIRKALGGSAGPKGLRSSLFVVKAGASQGGVPQKWTFTGAGFGHGVGMDQTGAVGRAKAGQDFRAILKHYYNDPKLETLY